MFELRKVVFITGTRADFGKLKSILTRLQGNSRFEIHVFVTGMHMLSKYGATWDEVRKAGLVNRYHFINQNSNDSMDHVLSKTIGGFADYVKEMMPDMIVVHGDRIEALAGAIVGALNNIRVAHIEGGEVSGTIDESIRHSISKLAHIHFVANDSAKSRLLQLGEKRCSIHVIGSPDIDIMNSPELPSLNVVREHYQFDFSKYSILMIHPVTTEIRKIAEEASIIVDTLIESNLNYVVIYPNNDNGSDLILREYERLKPLKQFAIYPSMRFEYFLTLLKNARFIIGNSSAGVREAPHFGVPAINIGTRQHKRVQTPTVLNIGMVREEILAAIAKVDVMSRKPVEIFGGGDSNRHFEEVLMGDNIWNSDIQKHFVDLAG